MPEKPLETDARRLSSLDKEQRRITNELEFQRDIIKDIKKISKDTWGTIKKRMLGERSLADTLKNQKNIHQNLVRLGGQKGNLTKQITANFAKGNYLLAAQQLLQRTYVSGLINVNRFLKKQTALVAGISRNWWMVTIWIATLWGWFKKLDAVNSNFRIQMGMWEKSVLGIQNVNREILGDLMHAGVTIEGVYEATMAVGGAFGSIRYASRDVTANLAYWKENLGVSVKEGAELLRVFSSVSGTSAESQVSMANFVQNMTEAAGIPLNETMQDIANASKTSYSMLSKSPLALAKAAVEARRLGTTLDAMAKSGRQLLDFTDSINAEMNASVLIGKAINLQRARELAYRKDQAGFQKELIRLTEQEVDFNSLDVFQQEAFAKALGKSTDEIAKMLTARRQERWIMANGTQEQKEQLRNLQSMESYNESMAKSQGEQAKKTMMQRANQAKLVQLQNTYNQFFFQLVEAFVPLLNTAMQIAVVLLKIAQPIVKAGIALLGIWKVLSWIFPMVLKIGTYTLKWVPILGLVVNVIGGIIYAWKDLMKLWDQWQSGVISFPQLIWKGFVAIADGIFQSLIWPFKKVWQWLEKTFFGHSASPLAEMILVGLKAIGSSIVSTLLNPFKIARWAIGKIFGGKPIASAISPTIAAAAGDEASGAVKVASAAAKSPIAQAEENRMAATEKLLAAVVNSINGLRDDLTSGKVVTNIDSQLASTISYRQTLFRKGYGTNQAVA